MVNLTDQQLLSADIIHKLVSQELTKNGEKLVKVEDIYYKKDKKGDLSLFETNNNHQFKTLFETFKFYLENIDNPYAIAFVKKTYVSPILLLVFYQDKPDIPQELWGLNGLM